MANAFANRGSSARRKWPAAAAMVVLAAVVCAACERYTGTFDTMSRTHDVIKQRGCGSSGDSIRAAASPFAWCAHVWNACACTLMLVHEDAVESDQLEELIEVQKWWKDFDRRWWWGGRGRDAHQHRPGRAMLRHGRTCRRDGTSWRRRAVVMGHVVAGTHRVKLAASAAFSTLRLHCRRH